MLGSVVRWAVPVVASSAALAGAAKLMDWRPLELATPTMTEAQLRAAKVIVREFRAVGLSDQEIAAAIVNAKAESNLDPAAVGDGGASVGLFQLHERGGGAGMTKNQRMDPVANTRAILEREVLADAGDEFRRAARFGASVSTLAGIFARDIERCAACQGAEKRSRESRALDMFGPNAGRLGIAVRLPSRMEP